MEVVVSYAYVSLSNIFAKLANAVSCVRLSCLGTWQQRSQEERIAAEALGYDEHLWMTDVDVDSLCSPECSRGAHMVPQREEEL